jgi:thioredoxin reductase
MKIYDLAIVGTGLAGALAAVIASEAGLEVLVLEKGYGPKDRKNLVYGWLGHSLYTMSRIDTSHDGFTNESAFDMALDCCRKANGGRLEQYQAWETLPGELPLRALGTSHYQADPSCGRELAQQFYQRLMATSKADILFGTEVERLEHTRGCFVLHTTRGKLEARTCLLSTGGHSAEWILNLCASFGLSVSNARMRLGLRVEVPARLLRTFLQVAGDLRLEAEDALLDDMRQNSLVADRDDKGLLSTFTYTTSGRHSERTSFMASFDAGEDFLEMARLVRIINVLANDRIRRERAIDFVHGHSVLEHLEQFNSIRTALLDLNKMVPSFLGCATVHIPETRIGGILPVDENMKTAFTGLYGAGGCTSRVVSPLGALASAMVAIQNIMEERNG